jgi:THO complex subunit 2
MERFHKEYLSSIDIRLSAAKVSQLAMAAPLESSGTTAPKITAPETKKEEPKILSNQKLELTAALLALGALRPAIAIMSMYPWLVDAHPELADLLLRALGVSIQQYYDVSITKGKTRVSDWTQARERYGASGFTTPVPRRYVPTSIAPIPPSTSTVDFVFFFPDWADRVPICIHSDDLVHIVAPLLAFVNVHLHRNTVLLTKLTRIGRALVYPTGFNVETKERIPDPDPEDPIRQFWLKMTRFYFIPALSLLRGNIVCAVEVNQLLRLFETTMRWSVYGEWKSRTYQSHPELRIRFIQADRESKGIMRRLSVQTNDSLSGTMAKLAHQNPTVFFTNVVNQVMAYDNLANVVTESMKFLTILGHDVLVYCILDALTNPNKERVKDDGVNTTDWLQSMFDFYTMCNPR